MKLCKNCGKEIIKRTNESLKQYKERKYCCHKCYSQGLKARIIHGYCTKKYVHPLYDAWRNIKRRCYGNYENSKYYKNYGGRGIKVCDEWKNDFELFLKWAKSNGWKSGLTIDRIDVNGNYCAENCRWITQKEQLANRRTSRNITYNGETKSAKEWAKILKISYSAFLKRLNKWIDINRVMEEPIHINNIR